MAERVITSILQCICDGDVEQIGENFLGIEVEGTWCGGLQYVDDIVLLASDQVELQVMLDVVGSTR